MASQRFDRRHAKRAGVCSGLLAGCRAGVVCTAYAQRVSGAFVEGEQKERAEAACIDTGLEALRLLAEMDNAVRAAGAGRGQAGDARAFVFDGTAFAEVPLRVTT